MSSTPLTRVFEMVHPCACLVWLGAGRSPTSAASDRWRSCHSRGEAETVEAMRACARSLGWAWDPAVGAKLGRQRIIIDLLTCTKVSFYCVLFVSRGFPRS